MSAILTIDASVFVAACRQDESGSSLSIKLLQRVRATDTPLIEPAILPVEVSSALARAGEEASISATYAESILSIPYMTILTVDERFARYALKLATKLKLRGADSLYAATALKYGAYLVTLDNEQLKRSPASIHACKPEEAIRLLK